MAAHLMPIWMSGSPLAGRAGEWFRGWDWIVAADLDADGQHECVIYNNDDEWTGVLKWNGLALEPVWMSGSPLVGPAGDWFRGLDLIVAADLDGDGASEIVIYDNDDGWTATFDWNPANGSSALQPEWMSGSPLVGPAGDWYRGWDALVAADLDGDEQSEIVIYNNEDGWAGVLQARGKSLEPIWMSASPLSGRAGQWDRGWDVFAAADLDADSAKEIVVYNNDDGWTGVMKFVGGALEPIWMSGSPLVGPAGDWFRGFDQLVAVDLDGDGKDEIVVYNNQDDWTGVLKFVDGALVPIWMSGSPLVGSAGDWYRGWDALVAADLDGDGADEIVVYNDEDCWTGALKFTDGVLEPVWMSASPLSGIAGDWFRGFDGMVAADIDGDGQVEVVVYNDQDNWTGVLKWIDVDSHTPASLLELDGTGQVTDYYGQEDSVAVSANLELRNPGATDVTLTRAYWAMTGPGGWPLSGLMSLIPDPQNEPGSVFGAGPLVPAGAVHDWGVGYGNGPYTHILWALSAHDRTHHQDLVSMIPVSRTTAATWHDWPSATTAPPPATAPVSPLALDGPVVVTLQEPVDQIDDDTGVSWVHVTGQLLNATGGPIRIAEMAISVTCSDGSVTVGPAPSFWVDPNMVDLVGGEPTENLALPFHLPVDLPAGKDAAELTIDLTWLDPDGSRHTVTRVATIEHPVAKALHLPFGPTAPDFVWNFGNGLHHAQEFTGHTWSISERYARTTSGFGKATQAAAESPAAPTQTRTITTTAPTSSPSTTVLLS